jgi:hypothetical protein
VETDGQCSCRYHRLQRGEYTATGDLGIPSHGRDCIREVLVDHARAHLAGDWVRASDYCERLLLLSTALMNDSLLKIPLARVS